VPRRRPLSPRPPELLVLNEPETSLHPDVLPALGDLIATATQQTQVVVTTHSADLAAHLTERTNAVAHQLVRDADGSTSIEQTAPQSPRKRRATGLAPEASE